jgi:hypothetical protein
MLSLKERLELLEKHLLAVPMTISVYIDLPFAIFHYDPAEEWDLRRELQLLSTRLANSGKEVIRISMAELLWEAIDSTEGMEVVIKLEKDRGFEAAQEQINLYLSDPDFCPLPELLSRRLLPLDPNKHIAFLMRAAAMAPAIYPISSLLSEMHGKTEIPTILFYPGSLEGTTGLRFMNLPDREAIGNYRVKIY